jgi:hypothetical protein
MGLAAFLGVAACVFQPDLSRFPTCDAQGACPTGWTCLGSEQVCLPDCGERGPCAAEVPTETDEDAGTDAGDPGPPDAGPPLLELAADGLAVGLETASYLHRFQASGGTPPYAFSTPGELPPGLSLTPQGELSGKPAAAGDFPFTLEVMDQGPGPQRSSQEFTLRIRPVLRLAGPLIPADVPSGKAYAELISATGGKPPYRFELVPGSSLPAGILLRDTGKLEGTASTTGTVAFDVRVTDAEEPPQVVIRTLQLTTGTCPSLTLCVRTRTVPDARVGTAYTYTLQTSGSTGSVTWKLASGALPPGVVLASDTGLLSGTPTQPGSYEFTLSVSDVFDTWQLPLSLKVF